ncbi:MAG: hypothetical protein R2724_16540 [Bryobacterales bacterium]
MAAPSVHFNSDPCPAYSGGSRSLEGPIDIGASSAEEVAAAGRVALLDRVTLAALHAPGRRQNRRAVAIESRRGRPAALGGPASRHRQGRVARVRRSRTTTTPAFSTYSNRHRNGDRVVVIRPEVTTVWRPRVEAAGGHPI